MKKINNKVLIYAIIVVALIIGGTTFGVIRHNHNKRDREATVSTNTNVASDGDLTDENDTSEASEASEATDEDTTSDGTTESHNSSSTEPTTQGFANGNSATQSQTTQVTNTPSTQAPNTQAPTTQHPGTQAPSTQQPTTHHPGTQAPSTQAPTTQHPTTQAPSTQAPSTQAPTTQHPTTQAPTTQQPTTQASATTEAGGHWERVWIVDSPAWTDEWDEYGSETHVICNNCGADITGNISQHAQDTKDENGIFTCWSWRTTQVPVLIQHHVDHYPEVGHWEEVWVED